MIAYAKPVDEAMCRMAFLQEALDDPTAAPCGRCDVCAGPWYSTDVPAAAAEAASAVLDRPGVELAPRAQWPTGADRLGVGVKGRIAAGELLDPRPARARAPAPRPGRGARGAASGSGAGSPRASCSTPAAPSPGSPTSAGVRSCGRCSATTASAAR